MVKGFEQTDIRTAHILSVDEQYKQIFSKIKVIPQTPEVVIQLKQYFDGRGRCPGQGKLPTLCGTGLMPRVNFGGRADVGVASLHGGG